MASGSNNNSASFLKQMIAYDACPCSPDDLSEKDIKNFYKSFNENKDFGNNNKIQSNKERKDLERKLSYFKQILRKIENTVNSHIKSLGLEVSQIKLDQTTASLDPSNQDCITKLTCLKKAKDDNGNVNKKYGNVSMNLNIKKLLNYPSTELYLIVTSSVLESVISKDDGINLVDVHNKNNRVLKNYNEKLDELNKRKDFKKAHELFTKYAKGFIKNYNLMHKDAERDYNTIKEINVTDRVVELVTLGYLEAMSEDEIKQVTMYNFSSLDKYEEQLLDEFKSRDEENQSNYLINASRLESINKNAVNAKTQSVQSNYNKQHLALCNVMLGEKFVNAKNGLQNGNNTEMKSFVEQYTKSVVDGVNSQRAADGLPPIDPVQVRFVNNPNSKAMGEYHEKGKGKEQWIEINLAKVTDIVDLASTLSHEITHYTDSASNRKDLGVGLLDDISENIKGSGFGGGRNPEAMKLLQDVNNYCYVVNPNERRARLSELSSYGFMLDFAGNDNLMKNQINKSMQGFISYQQKTIEHMTGLSSSIREFERRLNSLSLGGNTIGANMITKRIEYLKKIQNNFELSTIKEMPEFKAIEQAQAKMELGGSSIAKDMGNKYINEAENEVSFNSNNSANKSNEQARKNAEQTKKLNDKAKQAEIERYYEQQMGR